MEIEGAVAVVTGGASGIGRATAHGAGATRCADVALADIHEERLEEVTGRGRGARRHRLTVRCDVACDDHVEHYCVTRCSRRWAGSTS